MMRLPFAFLLAMSLQTSLSAQTIQSQTLDPRDTSVNKYTAVVPKGAKVKAIFLLVPGFAEMPANVLSETELPRKAAESGIATIIPVTGTGNRSFGYDSITTLSLRSIVNDAAARYGDKTTPLFVGGYSVGGTAALKYAEMAPKIAAKVPSAVVGIDPPLDMERLFTTSVRSIRQMGSAASEEDQFIVYQLQQEMGGTPADVPARYYAASPYSANDPEQRALQNLAHTPVLMISEPDVAWWMKQEHKDYESMNVIDGAGLVNELNTKGNQAAMLVTTSNLGKRANGMIHPHSWSIAEPGLVISWLLKQVGAPR